MKAEIFVFVVRKEGKEKNPKRTRENRDS